MSGSFFNHSEVLRFSRNKEWYITFVVAWVLAKVNLASDKQVA